MRTQNEGYRGSRYEKFMSQFVILIIYVTENNDIFPVSVFNCKSR